MINTRPNHSSRFAIAMLLTVGLLALSTAPASALSKHTFSSSFTGSAPIALLNPSDVDIDQATRDVYVADTPANEEQIINVDASGGTYTLSFEGQTSAPIAHNANPAAALEALATIGPGNISVLAGVPTSHLVFDGALAHTPVEQITADASGLSGASASVGVRTVLSGGDAADVQKFSPSGEFVLIFGKDVNRTALDNPTSTEAQRDVCTATSHDLCQPGTQGTTAGAFDGEYLDQSRSARTDSRLFLAVDNSAAGEGDIYVGDPGDGLVQKFDSSGELITSWGQGGALDGSTAIHGQGPDGPFNTLFGVAVDPAGTLFVSAEPLFGPTMFKFAPDSTFLTDNFFAFVTFTDTGFSLDPDGNVYAGAIDAGAGDALKLSPDLQRIGSVHLSVGEHQASGLRIDLASRDLYVTESTGGVDHISASCTPGPRSTHEIPCPSSETFGEGTLNGPRGIAIDEASGTVYVADTGNSRVAVFTATPFLSDASASAQPLTPTAEALAGDVDPAGAGPVTACGFEYVSAAAFEETRYADLGSGGSEACEQPTPLSAETPVSAQLSGLSYGTNYHYRLFADNANGSNASFDQTFETLPQAPTLASESASGVNADVALIHAQLNPGGGDATYHTTYHVDYGETDTYGSTSPDADAGSARSAQPITTQLSGLNPGVTYHYRVVATNASGTAIGPDRTFNTFPFSTGPKVDDTCPNAHVRQQTSAAGLLDCRAYELVSAADTAGYDVESNLVEGQTPYGGYPAVDGRALYGIHNGGVPGTGNPTNRGVDPYLAIRGEGGWSTSYVGIPANVNSSAPPFSSTLAEADPSLDSFAFAGAGLCSPCFSKGIETGIPLRLPSGELVQGMAGPLKPEPTSSADGYIARYFSADGTHFIFGSTAAFAAGGNESSGDVSIYDRNLSSGQTRVVSLNEEGEPLACLQGSGKCSSATKDANGIAELGISADGSRVLLAQKVSEDADHNPSWHLYMEIGDSAHSIDLTPGVISRPGGPGSKEGVLFAGMSADASRVFFTSAAKLLGEDTDASPDLYVAEVSGSASSLRLLSTGPEAPSNSDSCNPAANVGGAHWNTVGAGQNCGALAIGGGGGVASAGGAIYFLSPELLDEPDAICGIPCSGEGAVQNQPNLYLAGPAHPPRFIATLDPNDQLVLDATKAAGTRKSADFQLTPGGAIAAFASSLPLTGADSAGHTEIYRSDSAAPRLDCVSCTPTGATSTADASLAANGLSLTDDGRVFFTSADQLAAGDTDGILDAYQWSAPGLGTCSSSSASFGKAIDACLALVSAGTSTFDSALLGASADGTDAYFFTRDSLAPQDENGPTMKIYDARVQGGFAYAYPPVACKASDECHGPSSAAPGPLEVDSGADASTGGEEPRPCKKGFRRRHGKCVKGPKQRKRHHRKTAAHHNREVAG